MNTFIKNIKKFQIQKLLISLVWPFIAGGIGALFTTPSINNWYMSLSKPPFNPPNWIFQPVWTVIYILLGLSFFIIWTHKGESKFKKKAIRLFITQLILNSLWSIIFFGLKSPILAGLEIIYLWIVIFLTIKYFYKISKTAAYLLIPYIAWVTFAAFLNFSIVLLNP